MFAFRISSSKDVPSTNENENISYLYILSHNVFSYDEYNKIENYINISLSYQWKWKHWRHPDPDSDYFIWGQILFLLFCLNLPSSLGSLFSFFLTLEILLQLNGQHNLWHPTNYNITILFSWVSHFFHLLDHESSFELSDFQNHFQTLQTLLVRHD